MTVTSRRNAGLRQELRRQAILGAAAEEFASVGYRMATLDRIGERVGLSKPSLYHYVEGKEQLLTVLLSTAIGRITAEAALDDTAGPTDRLRAFVRAHVHVAVSTPEGRVLAENLDLLMSRSASAELASLRRKHEAVATDILTAGVRTGEFRRVAIRPAVKLLFGALNAVPRWLDDGAPKEFEQVLDQVSDILLSGILAR